MKLTRAFDHPEIVAYTYQADIYCPECILEVMDARQYRGSLGGDMVEVEDNLNEIASDPSYPIDRDHEYTFDSDIFPKVVFSHMLENDYCAGCDSRL